MSIRTGTADAVVRSGAMATFVVRSLSSVRYTLVHYRTEVLRQLADISWGSGAVIVGGGTIGVMVLLAVSAGTSLSADMEATSKPIFDEVRFGALVSADKSPTNDERGAFVTGMVFFDPWNHDEAQGFERDLGDIGGGGSIATLGREIDRALACRCKSTCAFKCIADS